MRHCNWCGRFVPNWQQPITRLLTATNRPRRNVRQLLCPVCAVAWQRDNKWNQPADPDLPIEDL